MRAMRSIMVIFFEMNFEFNKRTCNPLDPKALA